MDRKRLVETLIRHESLELKLYKCQAGKQTIGVGHNIDDNGISKKVAEFILNEDIENSEVSLRKFSWFEKLSDIRQEVLLNLHFNIGHTSFLKFKRMIWNLEKENFEQAAEEMKDSKWYGQVGPRSVYLVNAMKNNQF